MSFYMYRNSNKPRVYSPEESKMKKKMWSD